MDARTFDRLATSVAHQRSRRNALRMLAVGALAGLISPRRAHAALQADRDGDGLFDDDETSVYGTNPDVSDTDGDGFGDGEEVYYGSNPLAANSVAGVVGDGNDVGLGGHPDEDVIGGGDQGEAVACADDLVNCNGACVNLAFDLLHCGSCGNACPGGDGFAAVCSFGVCGLTGTGGNGGEVAIGDVNNGGNANGAIGVGDSWGDAAAGNGGVATCRGIGVACDYDTQCCTTGAVLCCWDGTSLQTECTDVTPYGGRCPM